MTEHKNIYTALAAAQSEMGRAVKDSANPAFRSKYADLAAVVEAVRPALNNNGIAFFHIPACNEFGDLMRTVLYHGASGTSIECDVRLIIGKNDMQGYKSATTYAKRIGLESVTGIAPDDDDGNAAAASVRNVQTEALAQAREDSVLDGLPENATPRQKAEAYADAICASFKGKGMKALDGEWSRWRKIIDRLAEQFQDLSERVIDAYETRKNEITDAGRVAAE